MTTGRGQIHPRLRAVTALHRLKLSGFGGKPLVNALGQLDGLLFTRTTRGFIDTVAVHNETSAIAARVRAQLDPHDPFVSPPDFVVWSTAGDVVHAVSAVLALPAPPDRGSRREHIEGWLSCD